MWYYYPNSCSEMEGKWLKKNKWIQHSTGTNAPFLHKDRFHPSLMTVQLLLHPVVILWLCAFAHHKYVSFLTNSHNISSKWSDNFTKSILHSCFDSVVWTLATRDFWWCCNVWLPPEAFSECAHIWKKWTRSTDRRFGESQHVHKGTVKNNVHMTNSSYGADIDADCEIIILENTIWKGHKKLHKVHKSLQCVVWVQQ